MPPRLNLVTYVRDNKGQPKACLYAETQSLEHPLYTVGFSACNPKDTFSKEEAIRIARDRARAWPERLENKDHPVPPSILQDFEQFMGRCQAYFKGKVCMLDLDQEANSLYSCLNDG
jgi:hypothetical protein